MTFPRHSTLMGCVVFGEFNCRGQLLLSFYFSFNNFHSTPTASLCFFCRRKLLMAISRRRFSRFLRSVQFIARNRRTDGEKKEWKRRRDCEFFAVAGGILEWKKKMVKNLKLSIFLVFFPAVAFSQELQVPSKGRWWGESKAIFLCCFKYDFSRSFLIPVNYGRLFTRQS